MKHRIVKQLNKVKPGQLFVCDWTDSDLKVQEKPDRDKVKMMLPSGIIDAVSQENYLHDPYLKEHKGCVYIVSPVWNGSALDFVWKTCIALMIMVIMSGCVSFSPNKTLAFQERQCRREAVTQTDLYNCPGDGYYKTRRGR